MLLSLPLHSYTLTQHRHYAPLRLYCISFIVSALTLLLDADVYYLHMYSVLLTACSFCNLSQSFPSTSTSYPSLFITVHLILTYMCILMCMCRELSVWTSNMRRAKDTAREVKAAHHVEWRSLREIEVRFLSVCLCVVLF